MTQLDPVFLLTSSAPQTLVHLSVLVNPLLFENQLPLESRMERQALSHLRVNPSNCCASLANIFHLLFSKICIIIPNSYGNLEDSLKLYYKAVRIVTESTLKEKAIII